MKNVKVLWTIIILLLGLSGFLVNKFISGEVTPNEDGRTNVVLTKDERNLVLDEMRAFLAAVQGIITAANTEDMQAVAKHAKAVGFAAQKGVPASLMKKLPLDFKKLGMGTHKAFDQLAMDAESLGDKGQTMEQLGALMQNCVACHAIYRIDPEMPK